MLTATDFKEKQIIFLKNGFGEDSTKLSFRNENVVFSKEGKVANQLSCHKVLAIFVIGETSLSTVLIRKAMEHGISIFFLKKNLALYSEIDARAEGNYLLRMKQYDEKNDFEMAKKLVENKVLNQGRLMKKLEDFDYKKYKKDAQEKIVKAKTEKELLGIEGNYSKVFFKEYFKPMKWYKRMPRTKVDEYNLLLDMGYTLLFNYVDSLLRLYGFDTYKGFYHKLFFQRKSLACDIMEPFRCLIDKQLLKAYNLGQIDKKDFKVKNGKYFLSWDNNGKYLKIFMEAIINNKEEIFNYIHEFYRYKMEYCENFPDFKIR